MRTRSALVALGAFALLAATAPVAPAVATTTEVRDGWCNQGEGLSVVADFRDLEGPGIPPSGEIVRCVIGGVTIDGEPRTQVLQAAGLDPVLENGLVVSLAGVEPEAPWMFSAARPADTVWNPTLWNHPADPAAFTDWAYGAAVLHGTNTVPRSQPQFADAPKPEPEPEPEPVPEPEPKPIPLVTGSTPTLAGATRVGRTLTARIGTWTPGATVRRQWLRNGAPIAGASGASYTLTPRDLRQRISIRITGSRSGHTSAVRTSAPSAVIRQGTLSGPRPRLQGRARVGGVLKVVRGTWRPGGVSTKVRWFRNGKRIAGATKARYRLRRADRGQRIRVRIAVRKPGYVNQVKTSAPRRIR